MTPVIYSTGFVIPYSEMLRKLTLSKGENVVGGLERVEVYTSSVYNKALSDYMADPTPELYVNLIDLVVETFREVSFAEFITMQVKNPYISPTSWRFLVSIIEGRFLECYNQFAVVPSNLKIVVNKHTYDTDKRRNEVAEKVKGIRFSRVLADISANPKAFLAFYQYLLIGI